MTPLGARTPHAHPALVPVIVTLSIAALAAIAWAFVTYDVFPDRVPPSPSPSPVGVEYRNEQFGLLVTLPESWRGFTTNTQPEDIYDVSGQTTENNGVVATFPTIHIQHPLSTATNPRQDIPVMVFTLEQWAHIQAEEWSVGAAPIPPSELARNSQYVFALPARYNYAFPEGWEEVQAIIDGGAVSAFEPGSEREAL
jgi:hypothetical protein